MDKSIFYSNDSGETWQEQFVIEAPQVAVRSFFAVSQHVVYAVGYGGLILKTSNEGVDWQYIDSPLSAHFYDLFFINENRGWICGDSGAMLFTNNGGETWEVQNGATDENLNGIHFYDDQTGWVAGSNGVILHTTNGGTNWDTQSTPAPDSFTDIVFISDKKGFAISSGGKVFATTDAGMIWTEISFPVSEYITEIDFADSLNGIVVGFQGTVALTSEGGETWNVVETGNERNYSKVCFLADRTIWLSGFGEIMKSIDMGVHWFSKAEYFVRNVFYNVISTKPGTLNPDQIYILCGHYDSITGVTERFTRAPGADDNGSGTATVIEAARILRNYNFENTIKFIFFSAEEIGLLGSKTYAQEAAANGENILGVINLDMIAYDSDSDNSFDIHVRDYAESQQLGLFVKDMVTEWSISLVPDYIPLDGTTRSDHSPFWDAGYSAILIIEDFSDFNSAYHSVGDLFTLFNVPYYKKMSQLAIISLAQLAVIDTVNTFISEKKATPIKNYSLSNPYPNPFNQSTTISFYLPETQKIKLSVYNLAGQFVAPLLDEIKAKGIHSTRWNSSDIVSGVYFIKMETEDFASIKKCVLLK